MTAVTTASVPPAASDAAPAARHLTHPRYRPDIDGLRAVAVLAVVGFHAFPDAVKGGFVGVDIFFVISGFLISTIIFSSLEQDRFSFAEFYGRRARRIFPALVLVLAFCITVGWFTLLADEFRLLAKHVVGGAGFATNLLLWRESGYFDTIAETKPLLHLWSLGIEEQFYIVWPLLLWAAWRLRFDFLRLTLALALLSFAANLYAASAHPVADFYSPMTRFWELLAGAALAHAALRRASFVGTAGAPAWLVQAQSLLGASFICAGIVLVTKDDAFPGYWALLPVLGGVLTISAGPAGWINRSILANPLVVWFGLISYPFYLWHWPLLSFARVVAGETPALAIRIAAVSLAIALAWATYKLVEAPLRFGTHLRAKIAGLSLAMTLLALAGVTVYLRGGLPGRDVVSMNAIIKSGFDGGALDFAKTGCGIANPLDQNLIAKCLSDNREEAHFALVGDSKAAALFDGLVRTSHEKSRWLMIGDNKGAAILVPVLSDRYYARSQQVARIALNAVTRNENIDTVLLATATRELFNLKNNYSIEDLPESPFYDAALDGLTKYVEALLSAGKRVVLLVDNPTLPDPKSCIARKTSLPVIDGILSMRAPPACTITIARHLELSQRYRTLLETIAAKHPESVGLFDPTSILCESERGICTYRKGDRLLYEYSDHISDYAAGLVGKRLNDALRDR